MFNFIANLKPYTFNPGRGRKKFDAYLLSVDYAKQHRKLATHAVRAGKILVADNGNVSRIKSLITRFETEGQKLDALRKKEEKKLGHYARPAELSKTLTGKYRSLAGEIKIAASGLVNEDVIASIVKEQCALSPTYSIGMEELTMPVLTALSIEPEYLAFDLEWYKKLTEQAVEYAVQTRNGDYGTTHGLTFAGLHAMNFDTAFQAGNLAGLAGVDGIASGLVGAMKDINSVDFSIRDGEKWLDTHQNLQFANSLLS